MADGHEGADDRVADVGPFFEDLFGSRAFLVADFAGAEDAAAAPPSFDVFDALEQLYVLAALCVDAAHLLGVGGDVTAAATLGMAEHDEEAARDVYDLRTPLLVGFLQDR